MASTARRLLSVLRRQACRQHAQPRFWGVHPAFFAVRRSSLEAGGAGAYSDTIERQNAAHFTRRRTEMNVMKNMEAIFLAAAFLTCIAGAASAASEKANYDAQVSVGGKQMAVVTVTAKRLTAEEKARI
jgi:hypothetical protein